ncbi:uncharacterized protein LOC117266331 [Epinephelus lanceolatus]
MGEMEKALKAVEDKYDDAVWIGLHQQETKRWHWSLADKDFYNEGEREYFIWGRETQDNCVTHKNGKLYSIGCPNLRRSVCFDGKKDQYVLTPTNMNWMVARDHCRTHYTDLASLRNDNEYQKIHDLAGTLQVWVGLYRDRWQWSDQSYSSLRYWNVRQAVYTVSPGSCGAMLKSDSGRWGELPCGKRHPFLCSCSHIVRLIKVKISLQDSVLDLYDPAVPDDILEQMRQELSKSINGTFQLQWRKQPDGRVFIKETRRSG